VWDEFPYTNKKIYVVITDIMAMSMATADPEKKKANRYLMDADAPVIWIFTRTSIAGQGRILKQEMETLYNEMGRRSIRALWMPMHRMARRQTTR